MDGMCDKLVRVLDFHLCGHGSIPGSAAVIRKLSLLFPLMPLEFSPGPPVFLPHQKSTIYKDECKYEVQGK